MQTDGTGPLLQNFKSWTTKDRKVADPSNESFCKLFFLKNRKTVSRQQVTAFFLLIPALYDVAKMFYLSDLFLDILF